MEKPIPRQAAKLYLELDTANEFHPKITAFLAALILLRWTDFQEAELEAIAAFEETEYKPVLPADLLWRNWYSLAPKEIYKLLTKQLQNSRRHNSEVSQNNLALLINRVSNFLNEPIPVTDKGLKIIIRWLAEQPFETANDRRNLLEEYDHFLYLALPIDSFIHRTPSFLCYIMVALASPSLGARIYDPCFGFADLLTAAHEFVRESNTSNFERGNKLASSFWGIEQNPASLIIGTTRLILAGVDSPQVELGNCLIRPSLDNLQDEGYDLALVDPPFGSRVDWGLIAKFQIHTGDTASLFIQHVLSQLRSDGRAVMVIPEGLLFRGGKDRQLRKHLVEHKVIQSIISLPYGIFSYSAGIKSCIIIFQKNSGSEVIRMVDGTAFITKDKKDQAFKINSELVLNLVKAVNDSTPTENSWDIDTTSLENIDYDLTPKRRNRSDLPNLLNSLKEKVKILEKEFEILPLSGLCKIRSGNPFDSRDLVTKKEADDSIPYIRIKDLQKEQVSKASSWLSSTKNKTLKPNWKLKAGDLLLSKSGTIGKSGIVRNGAVGAVAGGGFFILTSDYDRLDPRFLLSYLNSRECRAWLNDQARGATIRHLSIQVLQDLPVPLLPLPVQQNVASQYFENGTDCLDYLVQLLTEKNSDPVGRWLDEAIKNFSFLQEPNPNPINLEPLERLAFTVWPIRNQIAHSPILETEKPLDAWILDFSQRISQIKGVTNIPAGPGLLSILQDSYQGILRSQKLIHGHLPNESKARSLNENAANWIRTYIDALLGNFKLQFNPEVNTIQSGEAFEFKFEVQNQGFLPLRDLGISTSPDWGNKRIGYIAEKASEALTLKGIAPASQGRINLTVKWEATKIDGSKEQGSREIPFDVIGRTSSPGTRGRNLGGSPYICGDPVRPERNDVFFGREELIDQIRRQIIHSGNVVLLEGNRRAGKTSILRHLEGKETIPGWLAVYSSLQGAEGSQSGAGVPTVEIFREIAGDIARSLLTFGVEIPLPDGRPLKPEKRLGIAKACRKGIGDTAPFADFREYIETVISFLSVQNLRLLIMLDEFDKIQEGIDNEITSPQVPENIRYLVQTYTQISAILTGSRRLKRLRDEYWSALFGLGTRFGVSVLSVPAAKRLVVEPVHGRLVYSNEAMERVIQATACQPFLLQSLCNRIFDRASMLKTGSVTLDIVEESIRIMVIDNEHFASLWGYAGTDRRRFLLALCHRETNQGDPIRFGNIQDLLLENQIEITDEELDFDLKELRELELLELVGESDRDNYKLAVPLMGMWIDQQQDFNSLLINARNETEDQRE